MWEEIFSRGWENFLGRSSGVMNFRFWVQPAVALFLAVRAGLRDAREGHAPFLWNLVHQPGQRRTLLQQSWHEIRRVFIVALILDSIYQVIAHQSIYAGELLFTASVLALVPYAVCRGLVTRLTNLLGAGKQPTGPPGPAPAETASSKSPAL